MATRFESFLKYCTSIIGVAVLAAIVIIVLANYLGIELGALLPVLGWLFAIFISTIFISAIWRGADVFRHPARHAAKMFEAGWFGVVGVLFVFCYWAWGWGLPFILNFSDLTNGATSNSWPIAKGVVIELRPYRIFGRWSEWNVCEVQYRYSVQGIPFKSSRTSYSRLDPREDTAKKQYPVGTTVAVRYKQNDPAVAVLEPGFPWATVVGVVMWFLPVLFGLFPYAYGIYCNRYHGGIAETDDDDGEPDEDD